MRQPVRAFNFSSGTAVVAAPVTYTSGGTVTNSSSQRASSASRYRGDSQGVRGSGLCMCSGPRVVGLGGRCGVPAPAVAP